MIAFYYHGKLLLYLLLLGIYSTTSKYIIFHEKKCVARFKKTRLVLTAPSSEIRGLYSTLNDTSKIATFYVQESGACSFTLFAPSLCQQLKVAPNEKYYYTCMW